VPVDLRTHWAAALSDAGFDPSRRTAWLAEGFLMYLDRVELTRFFRRLTLISVPQSSLAIEHSNHAMGRLPEMQEMARTLASLGIEQKSTVEEPVGWLANNG
jgi:methyltransferase (TIGR00027 family)